MKKDILNIANILPHSEVNGPGVRTVIWLQGCKRRCEGCFNPDYQSFVEKTPASVHLLFSRIMRFGDEGVTFSGGEPFQQARPLSNLAKLLKENGKNIVCYTGYTYKYIKNYSNRDYRSFTRYIDLLIDGKYKKNIPAVLPYTGSGNQKLIWLNGEFKRKISPAPDNLTEIHIDNNGVIKITGFPEQDFVSNIKNNRRGK